MKLADYEEAVSPAELEALGIKPIATEPQGEEPVVTAEAPAPALEAWEEPVTEADLVAPRQETYIENPSIPEYLQYSWRMARYQKERANVWNKEMRGEITREQAIQGDADSYNIVSAYAGPYKELSLKEHPIKAALGMGVGIMPYMIDSQIEGAHYAAAGGLTGLAIAAAVGQVPPFTLMPEEAITVPGAVAAGMTVGYGYGVIKHIIDVEGGEIYATLRSLDNPVPKSIAAPAALAGGLCIGLLEYCQFKTLSKPLKIAYARAIGASVAKNGIVKAVKRYAADLGINIVQEEAQQIAGLVSKTIAGVVAKNPDAVPTNKQWMEELTQTAIQSGVAFGVFGLGGLGLDVTTSAIQNKLTKTGNVSGLLDKAINAMNAKRKAVNILTDEEAAVLDVALDKRQRGVELTAEESGVMDYFDKLAQEQAPSAETKATAERMKPDSRGASMVQKEIQNLTDRAAQTEQAEIELEQIDPIYKDIRRRLRKYTSEGAQKGKKYLAEELAGIPAIFLTNKETAMRPDEMVEYLNGQYGLNLQNESELKDYLVNLAKTRQDLIDTIQENKPGTITMRETTALKKKIASIDRGIREGKRLARGEAKMVQDEIIDALYDADIDAKDRAKFIRKIKNIQTEEQYNKSIGEIMAKIEKLEKESARRELVSGISKMLDRKDSKKLPVEYKAIFEEVADKIGLKKRSAKETRRIESMRNYVAEMNEAGEDIMIPDEELALLEQTSIDKLSNDQLADLLDVLRRLYYKGSKKNELLSAKADRDFQAVKKNIVDTITKGEGLGAPDAFVEHLKETNKNFAEATKDRIWSKVVEDMRPELMVLMLDGMIKDGAATRNIFNPLWESEKSRMRESGKTLEIIKDIHAELPIGAIFNEKYDMGRFKGITKDQALFIYAHSFNEYSRAHLEASGITDADIRTIKSYLTEKEQNAVANMLKFYDEYQYPAIAVVYEKLTGERLGKEVNYFPIDRLADMYNQELAQDILERKKFQRTGVAKGMTKARVNSTKAFSEFSYFDTIMRNVTKVEQFKAYAIAVRDVNKIINDPDIKKAITNKYGKNFHSVMDRWLKDVSVGGDKAILDRLSKISRWVRTNYVTAVLGLNLVTMAKQPASFLQGMEMAGKASTLKAAAEFWMNPLKMNRMVDGKSDLMKNRMFSQEREMRELLARRGVQGKLGIKGAYQNIKEKSLLPIVIADKITCDIVWMGAYKAALADGASEQSAIDRADMVIRRTQPMSGSLNLPETFRGSEAQKLFTMFRNQPNQNFNLLMETIFEGSEKTITPATFASHLAFYLFIPSILIGAMTRKRLPDDPGELAKDVVNGALGGVIFLGTVISMWASGYKGGSNTPLDAILNDTRMIFSSKDMEQFATRTIEFAMKLYGLPTVGIKRLLKGEPFGKIEDSQAGGGGI